MMPGTPGMNVGPAPMPRQAGPAPAGASGWGLNPGEIGYNRP